MLQGYFPVLHMVDYDGLRYEISLIKCRQKCGDDCTCGVVERKRLLTMLVDLQEADQGDTRPSIPAPRSIFRLPVS